jgi:hypothetical protein
MNDKSFSLFLTFNSTQEDYKLFKSCIHYDEILHFEGTREDEFKLLSFIWMFKVLPPPMTSLTSKDGGDVNDSKKLNEHDEAMAAPLSAPDEAANGANPRSSLHGSPAPQMKTNDKYAKS